MTRPTVRNTTVRNTTVRNTTVRSPRVRNEDLDCCFGFEAWLLVYIDIERRGFAGETSCLSEKSEFSLSGWISIERVWVISSGTVVQWIAKGGPSRKVPQLTC